MLKGLDEQATACQQDNGERRLNDDEGMTEPMAARARCAACAVAESLLRRESRASQGGRESEDQRCGDGDGGGEGEHAPIEREAGRTHGLRYKPLQKSHGGKGEGESGKGTEGGEH